MGIDLNESHHFDEPFMFDTLKSFRKDVGYLVSHRDIVELDTSFFYMFSNVMLPNMDVFRMCMECQINRKC